MELLPCEVKNQCIRGLVNGNFLVPWCVGISGIFHLLTVSLRRGPSAQGVLNPPGVGGDVCWSATVGPVLSTQPVGGGGGAQEVSFSYGWNQPWRAFKACAKQELVERVLW